MCCWPPEWLIHEIATRSSAPQNTSAGRYKYFDTKLRRVRVIALTSAFAAVTWTSFCITTAFVRLEPHNFTKLHAWLFSVDRAMEPLAERLDAAAAALREASRPLVKPVVTATDSIGIADSPLPLSMAVTNYTPDTQVIFSGLAAGSTLTSGVSLGERRWRLDIENLANTYVIPPRGYVGFMKLVAELRDIDGRSLSYIPVRLTWNATDSSAKNEAAETKPLDVAAAGLTGIENQELYAQQLPSQAEKVALPKPRPVRLASSKFNRTKKQIAATHGRKERAPPHDPSAGADRRWASNKLPTHSSLAEPDLSRERWQVVDGIFRTIIGDGRTVNECGAATLKRGPQRRLKDDCQWN